MPKIIQICEVFDFHHQNSVACVGDNGVAYMLNRDKMAWEPLPDLPEEKTSWRDRWDRGANEMMRQESIQTFIKLEYCTRCKYQRSVECRYCEATDEVRRPTRFVESYLPEEPDFAVHADVTMGVK
jgi:hypothetical protein